MTKPSTVSLQLASEVLTAAGISCLRISALAGHPSFSRLTIAGIDDRKTEARRLWLQSRKAADKVMREVFSSDRDRRSRRSEDGLVFEADIIEVERVVVASARLIGVTTEDDSWFDAALLTIALRSDAMIRQMKQTGRLKLVNAAYAALPLDDRPPFNAFLVKQLSSAIHPADVRLLLSSLRRAA